EDVPRSWQTLEAYLAAQYAAGTIAPGGQARELAAALCSPVHGPAGAPLTVLVTLIAAGLLPAPLREAYGFDWSRGRAGSFDAENDEDRLRGQVEAADRAEQDDERRARHAGDPFAREHQRQQQQELLADGHLDARRLRHENRGERQVERRSIEVERVAGRDDE